MFKQIKKMLKGDSKVLFLGVTFKEDVPDLRNSKALELLSYFNNSKFNLTVNDPFVSSDGYKSFKEIEKNFFDAIILTVPHTFYKTKLKSIQKMANKNGIIFDIIGIFRNKNIPNYWSL